MTKKATNKTIAEYLEKIGAADPTNIFLQKEVEFIEKIGNRLKSIIDKEGPINAKGRISQEYLAYKIYVRMLIDLSTKLGMTVQDRKKFKLTEADAVQLSFDEFHAESSN